MNVPEADGMSTDEDYLNLAITAAVGNVENKGGPFGAVVLMPDGFWATGANRVTASFDPTAHGEVMAIRNACLLLDTHDLTGGILFTSCAPCPMCLSSTLWARISRIVYAASPEDAAAAGFDDTEFYTQVAGFDPSYEKSAFPPLSLTAISVTHIPTERRLEPFEAWNSQQNRIDY